MASDDLIMRELPACVRVAYRYLGAYLTSYERFIRVETDHRCGFMTWRPASVRACWKAWTFEDSASVDRLPEVPANVLNRPTCAQQNLP
jgi:hypothetical protein